MSIRSFNTLPNDDDFGLIAWLENTRIRLPLKAVDVRFEIADAFAKVEIDSVFHNARDEALDVQYTFPLPSGASIYRCEMISDGRAIQAVVEERGAARKAYDKAKAEGRRIALVEQQRENCFRLALGNVQANEVVVLRLAYVQEVEKAVRSHSLRVPLCPCQRYVPGTPLLRSNQGSGASDDTDQVPDASLISPPRIDQLHPDAALLRVVGKFPNGMNVLDTVHSPSHSLAIRSNGGTLVSLAGDADTPDRDFIVRWDAPRLPNGSSRLICDSENDSSYGLLTLMPPDTDVKASKANPRGLWFLLDCSGSMSGRKWQQTCQALIETVRCLSSEDLVFVTLFDSSYRHFAEKPLPPERLLQDPNFINIQRLFTGGGTEMLPAIKAALATRNECPDLSREDHLIIITDGQVANEAAVHAELARSGNGLSVHAIGIALSANDSLLKPLAASHGGQCMFLSPQESIQEAVELILLGAKRCALSSLKFSENLQPIDSPPRRLSPGVEYSFPVELKNTATKCLVQGLDQDQSAWQSEPAVATGNGELLQLIGIRRKITVCERERRLSDAIELAKTHNLLCEGASFIAIDRETKLTIATERFEQPAMIQEYMKASSLVFDHDDDLDCLIETRAYRSLRPFIRPPSRFEESDHQNETEVSIPAQVKSLVDTIVRNRERRRSSFADLSLYLDILSRKLAKLAAEHDADEAEALNRAKNWLSELDKAVYSITRVWRRIQAEDELLHPKDSLADASANSVPRWLKKFPELQVEYDICQSEQAAFTHLCEILKPEEELLKILNRLRSSMLTSLADSPEATSKP